MTNRSMDLEHVHPIRSKRLSNDSGSVWSTPLTAGADRVYLLNEPGSVLPADGDTGDRVLTQWEGLVMTLGGNDEPVVVAAEDAAGAVAHFPHEVAASFVAAVHAGREDPG